MAQRVRVLSRTPEGGGFDPHSAHTWVEGSIPGRSAGRQPIDVSHIAVSLARSRSLSNKHILGKD